jgi:hypothetical protein
MLLYNALGEIGMSKDLEDLSIALFNGELPAMWRIPYCRTFQYQIMDIS